MSASPYSDLFIYYIQGRVSIADPGKLPGFIGNWEEDGFSFLFFSELADTCVARIVATKPGLVLLDQYRMRYDDWQGGSVDPFQTGIFFVAPPWDTSETPEGLSRIVLDPGVVFGTGTHPTTGDCLAFLQRICAEEQIETVIDAGTGTGLLALAAARLGCRKILALDFNFLAARTAGINIRHNHLAHRVLAFQGKAEEFTHIPADLFIANIHYEVMKELIRRSEGFRQNRWFILSGLLRSQARDIPRILAPYPVQIVESRTQDGIWHSFLGRTDCNMSLEPVIFQ